MEKRMVKQAIVGVILVFLLSSGQVIAQKADCVKYNRDKALKEIKNNSPKIVIVGGIVSAIRPGDEKFAIKYKVQFIDTGCVTEDNNCIAAYNKATFEYLDKKYGKKWRKYARKDLLGL